MKQKFTVTEIVNDTAISNPEKIRLLYLQHDKNYKEIADLLGLKESTVKFNVSNGGYCKNKPGYHPTKYGDIRATIKKMYDENPNITSADIMNEIGCSYSIIRSYASELGIELKRCKRGTIKKSKASSSKKSTVESNKTCLEKSTIKDEIIKSEESEEIVAKPVPERNPDQSVVVTIPIKIEESPRENQMDSSETYSKESTMDSILQDTDIEKPYEILEWPMVLYNGHVYEVLSPRKLRRELKVDLNIKSKINKKSYKK